MATTENVRVYEIATGSISNLNNDQFAFETVADADLSFKMPGGKNDDGTVLRFLCKDQDAQVADLNVTGDATISSGTITIDALSLSTASANRILYGDFSQSSTFLWQNSKLRIGATGAPTNQVDIAVTSADGVRVENTAPDASHPLRIFEKTSASPADNDGIGQTIYRGLDGNQSAPAKRDYVTVTARSTDVSAVSADYSINVMRDGVSESYIFAGDKLTIPREIVFSRWGGLVCGEIYVEENATGTDLALQDTYYQVAIFDTNGESNGMTPDHTNDHITVLTKGRYFVTISMAAYSSADNEYHFHLYKNNGSVRFDNVSANRNTANAGKVGSLTASGIIQANVGDTLELWVERTDGGGVSKTITISHVTMSAVLIGGWS